MKDLLRNRLPLWIPLVCTIAFLLGLSYGLSISRSNQQDLLSILDRKDLMIEDLTSRSGEALFIMPGEIDTASKIALMRELGSMVLEDIEKGESQ